MRLRRSIAALAIAALAAGCGGLPGTLTTATAGPVTPAGATPAGSGASPTATFSPPPGATPMRDGTLKSGVTYATPHFAVPFTIAVPSATPRGFWFATSTGLARSVAIGDPAAEGVGLAFYLPTGGFGTDGSPAALPSDFVSWLEHDPQLNATAPRSVTVGGRTGTEIDAAAVPSAIPVVPGLCPAHQPCVLVGSTTPEAPLQPLLIYPGTPQRIIVIDVDAGQLLIDVQPDVVIRRPAQRLLASLRFLA